MKTALEQCKEQARLLPIQDRAVLIEQLVASLDESDEAECERLWAQEAERRYEAYKTGDITARPADKALKDARDRLANIG